MIRPALQWAIQIDVTTSCVRRCSNCTRMIGHRAAWRMELDTFRQAVEALREFPSKSPHRHGDRRQKVLGIIGGEPLMHPQFPELCEVFRELLPNPAERALWSGINLRDMAPGQRNAVLKTFSGGFINPNDHSGQVYHHPVLVAAQDVYNVAASGPLAETEMWAAIHSCELQERWSANVTPQGFFFCEVAGCLDMTFDGPGGLPVEPGCWDRPLEDFREQIARWCPRCGICVRNLGKRRDAEERDDVSATNLAELRRIGSGRIEHGRFVLWTPGSQAGPFAGDSPLAYLKKV